MEDPRRLNPWRQARVSAPNPMSPPEKLSCESAGNAALRRRYVRAVKAADAERKRLEAAGVPSWRLAEAMQDNPHRLDHTQFAALCCGAKTRKGTPCKRTDLYANGRCVNHGGLSTGPTSEAGKLRALANLAEGVRAKVDGTP